MYLTYLFFLHFIFAEARKLAQKPHYGDSKCDEGRLEGDCAVQQCVIAKLGHACEARFVRYNIDGKEYSRKTCRCLAQPVCSITELTNVGCMSYSNMTQNAQSAIRRWTMNEAEKASFFEHKKLYGNEYYPSSVKSDSIYSDAIRHAQLLNAKTKFCCRIDNSAVNRKFTFSGSQRKRNFATKQNSLRLLLIFTLFYIY